MADNYEKAYREIYEIFKYLPKEEVEKIPIKIRDTIKECMDKNYNYQFQEELDFQEQNLLKETRSLLAVLYRDYWATDIERKRIIEVQKNDIKKYEKQKSELYSYEDLWKNRKAIQENEEVKEIIIYKDSWYKKFIDFIKQCLKRK